MMKTLLTATPIAALLCLGLAAEAKPPGGGRGPPPEAIAACEGKQAGDACSFEGRRGAEEGSCFAPREDLPLACRPANAPPPRDNERGSR